MPRSLLGRLFAELRRPGLAILKALIISPYYLARWIYGRGTIGTELVALGTRGLPGGTVAPTLADKIPSARAVAAVGVVMLALRLVLDPVLTWPRLGAWAYAAIRDGVVEGMEVMLISPFVVLVLGGVLAGIARAEHRPVVLRAIIRPAIVSAVSGAGIILLLIYHAEAERLVLRTGAGKPVWLPGLGETRISDNLLLASILVWLMLFVIVAPFLVHRNGIGTGRGIPLLPPLATVCVVWLLVLLGLTDAHGPLDAYGTPVLATALAVAEIIWLRRKGVGFRGPLPPRARRPGVGVTRRRTPSRPPRTAPPRGTPAPRGSGRCPP